MHRRVQIAVLTACMIAGSLARVSAEETEWKTIRLQERADFTIDIPAGVDPVTDKSLVDPALNEYMAFFATTDAQGDFSCLLHAVAYPAGATQKSFSERLAQNKGETFCEDDRPGVSNGEILSLRSTTSNGLAAAACVSGYTRADQDAPGFVSTALVVAASKRAFVLACQIQDTDQESAELGWESDWKDIVTHIQDSLKLPDALK